jgi:hypothetical protein
MINALKVIINRLAGNPGALFLMDSLGALTTALLLFLVLRNYQEYFGMPEIRVNFLAAVAGCFYVYSLSCYLFLKRNWAPFLQIIGVCNLLYCALTAGLLIIHHAQLTFLGYAYFLGEIAIIGGLAYIELIVAKVKRKQN